MFKKQKFNILTNESTDIGSVKTSCCNKVNLKKKFNLSIKNIKFYGIYRFYNGETKRIESVFCELHDVFNMINSNERTEFTVQPTATGKRLFNSLIKTFTDRKIPLVNSI